MSYSFQGKKVILFDWNRTLVDTGQAFDDAFIHMIEAYTGRWEPPSKNWSPSSVLQTYKAEWRNQRRKLKHSFHPERAAVLSMEQALKELPLPKNPTALARFHRQILNEKKKFVRPLPHVVDVLEQLSRTYTIAIVSNSENIQLKHAGLSKWITPEHCFTAADAGARKPNPALFRYALAKLKTPPAACLMVGNSWRTDIRGAERAQLDAVWINKYAKTALSTRKYGRIHVAAIRSLSKLLQLL